MRHDASFVQQTEDRRLGTVIMGYCRVQQDDQTYTLRLACDGIHGMVSTTWRDFSAGSFFGCIDLAKRDGWLIEKGPAPQDGQELSNAYCPTCASGIDWEETELGDTF